MSKLRRVLTVAIALSACGPSADTEPKAAPTQASPQPESPPRERPLEPPVKLKLPATAGSEELGPIDAAIWIGSDGIALSPSLEPEQAKVILPLTAGALTPELQAKAEETGGILIDLLNRSIELTDNSATTEKVLAVFVDEEVPFSTLMHLQYTVAHMRGFVVLKLVTGGPELGATTIRAPRRDEPAYSLHLTLDRERAVGLWASRHDEPSTTVAIAIDETGTCWASPERAHELIRAVSAELCRLPESGDLRVYLAADPTIPHAALTQLYTSPPWPSGCTGEFRLEPFTPRSEDDDGCDGELPLDGLAAHFDRVLAVERFEAEAGVEASVGAFGKPASERFATVTDEELETLKKELLAEAAAKDEPVDAEPEAYWGGLGPGKPNVHVGERVPYEREPSAFEAVELRVSVKARNDGLDADIVKKIIVAHRNEIRVCATSHGMTKGRLKATIVIGASGKPSPVTVETDNEELEDCTTKAFERWTFPRVIPGEVTFDITLTIEPS